MHIGNLDSFLHYVCTIQFKKNLCCVYVSTAYCIWSVISSLSNLNQWSRSLGLFYHGPSERAHRDWNWRLRLHDTPNAIGCIYTLIHLHLRFKCLFEIPFYIYITYAQYSSKRICARLNIYTLIHPRVYERSIYTEKGREMREEYT